MWARSWCSTHYSRWRQNGSPDTLQRHRRPDGLTGQALLEWCLTNQVKQQGDCLVWTGSRFPNNYGRVSIGKGIVRLVHRFVYAESHGTTLEAIGDLHIRHTCDNPPCINPEHLDIGTSADNHADMVKRQRSTIGEHNSQAKLSDQQVLDIRAIYATGKFTQSKLGNLYGVGHAQIGRIIRREQRSTILNASEPLPT